MSACPDDSPWVASDAPSDPELVRLRRKIEELLAADNRIGCLTPALRVEISIEFADELRLLEQALVLLRRHQQSRPEPSAGPAAADHKGDNQVARGKYISACDCVTGVGPAARDPDGGGILEEHSIWCRICSSLFEATDTKAS